MPENLLDNLEEVSQTMLITLMVRARESRRAGGLLHDDKAVEMVQRMSVDFSKLNLVMHRHDEVAVLVRMIHFDRQVQRFAKEHPGGVIVHFGCGLDTRYERTAPEQVEWFDLDVPTVMALRQKLIGTTGPHYHALGASIFETNWISEVKQFQPGPFLFTGEGVLPYFEAAQVQGLFLRLVEHFPGCEVIFDAHTPFVIWADNIHLALAKVPARMHWKLKNPREMEHWHAGFKLLDEWYYYEDDDPIMRPLRWMRLIPGFARASGIFHFQLGDAPTQGKTAPCVAP